jgi:branched-chain amino acid aminotransferase
MQQALSAGAAWMNGNIIPISEASIPVTDWELTHSDITYDVAPVRDGAFFRLIDYIDRFFASMAALQLNPNMTKQQVQDALIDMVAASAMRESYVAMVCSWGVQKIAGSRDPRDCRNHFYAW